MGSLQQVSASCQQQIVQPTVLLRSILEQSWNRRYICRQALRHQSELNEVSEMFSWACVGLSWCTGVIQFQVL